MGPPTASNLPHLKAILTMRLAGDGQTGRGTFFSRFWMTMRAISAMFHGGIIV